MSAVAIIPARGGSKRIPRKNIKDFLGKPIIAYSIELALQSKLFTEVMVSTDDDEIADVAKRYGASVPFVRSEKNASDYATTADVIVEVLDAYRKQQKDFEQACCIYPTAPLAKVSSLKKALELLKTQHYHTVFPVVPYSFPIWRSVKVSPETGKAEMLWNEHLNTRSQDLPKAFHDAGQFYWMDVKAFLQEKLLYSSHTGVIELPEMEVQDIDNAIDWQLAELKYKLSHEG